MSTDDPGAPPARPTPTHVVEVYLVARDGLFGQGRAERYFYAAEAAAQTTYAALGRALKEVLSERTNAAPQTLEVDDLYGCGTLVTRDLKGVRLIAQADLSAWGIDQEAHLAGAKARAKHLAMEDVWTP